ILLPAYRFSIGFQRTQSSISEVIPSLLILFNTWNKLSLNQKYKTFEFELNSNAYVVAALLDTSKLSVWYWKKFSEEFSKKALYSIVDVALAIL
ncbi:hypothetical protein BpHYR1_010399, partial [Brachionus plicatilis]